MPLWKGICLKEGYLPETVEPQGLRTSATNRTELGLFNWR